MAYLDAYNPAELVPAVKKPIEVSDNESVISGKARSERSDSYSSVREDFQGLPQSFIVTKNVEEAVQEWVSESSLQDAPRSPKLLALPTEVLERIFTELMVDLPSLQYAPRNRDLRACLLVNRRLSEVATKVLYQHVTVPHSYVFSKFCGALSRSPGLGRLVRRLDLSHFSSMGLGRTRQCNQKIQNLTSETLLGALQRMPLIKEVLLQHHVDQDIDTAVLEKLFYGLPSLEALDLCGSSCSTFVSAFSAAVGSSAQLLGIKRLSLHDCYSLKSDDLCNLLSRLPQLEILDLFHTRVTDECLNAIPATARLTHLNVGRCTFITGEGVVDFLSNHPAAKSLVYLNLSCDVTRHRLLHEADVDALFPVLPRSLKSLHISGAQVHSAHVPQLQKLAASLEELSIAHANVSIKEIASLVGNRRSELRYLNVSDIAAVTQPALFANPVLFDASSEPLEVLEIGSRVAESLAKAKGSNTRLGWTVKEFGKRSWYVRQTRSGKDASEDGREWKMGARWWGMRKVPVAWSEVGGLYGHYMFKA